MEIKIEIEMATFNIEQVFCGVLVCSDLHPRILGPFCEKHVDSYGPLSSTAVALWELLKDVSTEECLKWIQEFLASWETGSLTQTNYTFLRKNANAVVHFTRDYDGTTPHMLLIHHSNSTRPEFLYIHDAVPEDFPSDAIKHIGDICAALKGSIKTRVELL